MICLPLNKVYVLGQHDSTINLRIDNRTYCPFWWRCSKMETVISLLRSYTCDIYILIAYFMAFSVI